MTTWIFYTTAILTMVLGFAGLKIVLNRLDACRPQCSNRARLKYTTIGLLLIIGAVQPWFREQLPGVGSLSLVIIVLILLVTGCNRSVVIYQWLEMRRFRKIDDAWQIETNLCNPDFINDMHAEIKKPTCCERIAALWERVKQFFRREK